MLDSQSRNVFDEIYFKTKTVFLPFLKRNVSQGSYLKLVKLNIVKFTHKLSVPSQQFGEVTEIWKGLPEVLKSVLDQNDDDDDAPLLLTANEY